MSDKNRTPERDLDKEIERLEDKIKNLDELTKARIQTTEESRKTFDEVFKELIDTKIDSFEKRFKVIFRSIWIMLGVISVSFSVVISLLYYMGYNTIENVDDKIDLTMQERLNSFNVDSLIQEIGNIAIDNS